MKKLMCFTVVIWLNGCGMVQMAEELDTHKQFQTANSRLPRTTEAQKEAAKKSIIARLMHPELYAIYITFPPYAELQYGKTNASCKDVNEFTELCVYDNHILRKVCVHRGISNENICYKEYFNRQSKKQSVY